VAAVDNDRSDSTPLPPSIRRRDLIRGFLRELRPLPSRPLLQRISWGEILKNMAPILALSGVAMYGILTLAYTNFYGALGVNAADVGYGYAAILANSVGAVVAFLLLTTIAAIAIALVTFMSLFVLNMYLVIRHFAKEFPSSLSPHDETGFIDIAAIATVIVSITGQATIKALEEIATRVRNTRKWTLRVTLSGVLIVAVSLAGYALPHIASSRAMEVRAGNAATPPRLPIAGVTLLPIRADPSTVEAIGETGKTPAVTELATRPVDWPPLFYLGQAGGIAVFYDSRLKESIRVAASAILLRVRNCEDKALPDNLPSFDSPRCGS
jgi:hypothetical protein